MVLQSIQGEAGGFQQLDLFSLNTNTNTNLLQDKGVQLSQTSSVIKNIKIVLAASNSSPENPVVLQSTKGEAGGFQQFNLFSLSTNTNTNLLQDKEVQLSSNFKCCQKS